MCSSYARTRSSEHPTCYADLLSGGLGNVRCLRSFLTLSDFEFHWVTFLQALVSLGSNCAVVNKYVRAIRASDEPVSFGVIEPLDGSFQTFHVPPSFRTS